MQIIVSLIMFIITFFLILEIIFSLNVILTILNAKQISNLILEYISDINFYKSMGKELPKTNLKNIFTNHFKWIPNFMKNHLPLALEQKTIAYLMEESISSRERTRIITKNIINNEKWFFSFKYDEIISIISFTRNLYVPMGVLCSLVIFIIGYSKIGENSIFLNFETISRNIFIISFTMKNAALTLSFGLFAYIISCAISFFLGSEKIHNKLSEALFQLKACHTKIDKK